MITTLYQMQCCHTKCELSLDWSEVNVGNGGEGKTKYSCIQECFEQFSALFAFKQVLDVGYAE